MDPSQFIRSVYMGDRTCKSIVIDGWKAEVRLQLDCISRVRGDTWNYYRDEDLPDGIIVLEGAKKIEWDSNNRIPNDAMIALPFEPCPTQETKYIFHIEIASGDEKTGEFTPVRISILANGIALQSRNGT